MIPVRSQIVKISGYYNALTWRPGWRPGQWHPASGQDQALGATDLGFGRSVPGLHEYSSFDCELV